MKIFRYNVYVDRNYIPVYVQSLSNPAPSGDWVFYFVLIFIKKYIIIYM